MKVRALVPELMVTDVERSIAFYTRQLGFELVGQAPEDATPTWAEIANGEHHVMLQAQEQMLAEMPSLGTRPLGSTALFVCRIGSKSEVARAHSKLLHETSIVMPLRETDYGTMEFALADPDGYVILISGE